MSENQWNERNTWLNRLSSEFYQRTYGHICNAAFEATADDTVLVCGDANSYYAVQLALLVIQHCRENDCPFRTVRLTLSVGNQPLEIVIPKQPQPRPRATTTEVDSRQRELTLAAAH